MTDPNRSRIIEVYSFEAFRKKIQDELRTSDRADMKDIQTSAFDRYLTIMQEKKPDLSGLSAEVLCRLLGFTDQGRPTLAASSS